MNTCKPIFVAVMNFTNGTILTKVGPFHTDQAAAKWASGFRAYANERQIDATALPSHVIESISSEVGTHAYFPTQDPRDIFAEIAIGVILSTFGNARTR